MGIGAIARALSCDFSKLKMETAQQVVEFQRNAGRHRPLLIPARKTAHETGIRRRPGGDYAGNAGEAAKSAGQFGNLFCVKFRCGFFAT